MIIPTVYTASKTRHAPMWRQLRAQGTRVISTWIDEAEQGQTQDFEDLWIRCVYEASTADVLLAYRQDSEEILKGAFVEIGCALSQKHPVIAVGDWGDMSFLHHPLVVRSSCVQDAVRLVSGMRSCTRYGERWWFSRELCPPCSHLVSVVSDPRERLK